eukprot:CAMPEP_0203683068 /NCGR_PEP_ID=MMETSP0090-20130426/47326_1 /ASSEMBLY_ACC=CAM_ASM_001088 /TAXON_ID=426623 /ORGANISM="Chaetoceros affinis, Strain CCMP159" /LENGTH=387 /DNA_ID=CAMNT_0050552189 /DNA_START=181 /DNA_END=1344 /DNA_ORIENTATION=+
MSLPTMWKSKTGKDDSNDSDDGRINMRGITFDDNGTLLALPFPKFFNNGEMDETSDLDLGNALWVCEKMDGSLISFFKVNGMLEVKTMKSVSGEVANFARRTLFNGNEEKDDAVGDEKKEASVSPNRFSHVLTFASSLIDIGLSPMFEFISPMNQIVIDYDEDDFVFLGARSMKTGRIYLPNEFETINITVPRMMPVDMIDNYLEEKNVEGVVITMQNGLMFKMKSSEYVQQHKAASKFAGKAKWIVSLIVNGEVDDIKGLLSKKKWTDNLKCINAEWIVSLIVNGEVDDVKGLLSKKKWTDNLKCINAIEMRFIQRYNEIYALANDFLDHNKFLDRKGMAIKINNDFPFGKDSRLILAIVMKILDGREYRDFINSYILKESKGWTI